MTWIKLCIHPEHEKVLRVADLTGGDIGGAFVAVVRWFWWVDSHVDGTGTTISFAGFRSVTRWPDDGLAKAMTHADVDWLTESDGMLRPTRPDSHFGKSARRRALDAVRKTSARQADESRTVCGARPEPDQTKRNTSGLNQTSGVVSIASGLGGWPEWTVLGRKAMQAENIAGVLRDLGLREPLLRQTAGLVDISVREIVAMAEAVGCDPSVYKPSSRAAIVADRLFRARQLERPREHRGGKATKVAGHLNGADISGLHEVVKRRRFG